MKPSFTFIDKTTKPRLPVLELYSHRFDLANAWVGIADGKVAWISFTTPSSEVLQNFWSGEIKVHADDLPKSFETMPRKLEPIIQGKIHFPVLMLGTPFQLNVWQRLLEIPSGQTRTYGEIARDLQLPNHARAVGNAVAANPIACIVPCHRVLPSNQQVGNYRWGPFLKSRLLEAEALCV